MQQAETVLNESEQAYFDSRGESSLDERALMEENLSDHNNDGDREVKGAIDSDSITKIANTIQKTVPHAALHAEREEHKKTRAQLHDLREEAGKLKAFLQTTGTNMRQENEGDLPPDPEKDFIGFTRWHVNQINRLRAELAAEKQRESNEKQAMESENALWQEWNQSVAQSRNELSDLDSALNFLGQARDNQLKALAKVDARFGDAGFRGKQMKAELRDIVALSLREGENPAKALYEVAKGYGYGAQNLARFKALDAAQNAARSLTASHGRDAGDPMLLETVAGLSEQDFLKWYDNNRDAFRKMFGG